MGHERRRAVLAEIGRGSPRASSDARLHDPRTG